mmetsp:Transcript_21030/g.43287  ORF Transcript_21030/g.43287 Transcript_21030/m.43287 type:complete len:247 (-) Transcript_21030:274-1014(-)
MISADVSSNALRPCESASSGSKTLHSSSGDWNRTLLWSGAEGKSCTLVGDVPFVDDGVDAALVFFMALLIDLGPKCSEDDEERKENFDVSVDDSEKEKMELPVDESELLLLFNDVLPAIDESSIRYCTLFESVVFRECKESSGCDATIELVPKDGVGELHLLQASLCSLVSVSLWALLFFNGVLPDRDESFILYPTVVVSVEFRERKESPRSESTIELVSKDDVVEPHLLQASLRSLASLSIWALM